MERRGNVTPPHLLTSFHVRRVPTAATVGTHSQPVTTTFGSFFVDTDIFGRRNEARKHIFNATRIFNERE